MKKKHTLNYHLFWLVIEIIVTPLLFIESLGQPLWGWGGVRLLAFTFMLWEGCKDFTAIYHKDYKR